MESAEAEIISANKDSAEGLISDSKNNSNLRLVRVAPVVCRLSGDVSVRLAEIERDSNSPPWSEKLFAGEFNNSCSLVYGARLDGQIVGFLVCHVVIDEAHIVNFAIDKQFRQNGIGRTLINYALRDFHHRGVRWVTLEVRVSNMAARALYDSLGFSDVGRRTGYYPDNQEDAIVMSLNIRQFIDSFGVDESAMKEFPQT